MSILISPHKKRYKVNLHCHSTVSDGTLSPAEVKEAYKAAGYSAVAFTDHQVLLGHTELCDEGFIALHGYEVNLDEKAPSLDGETLKKTYHINLIAKEQDNLIQPCFHPAAVPEHAKHSVPFVRFTGELFPMEYSAECANAVARKAAEHGFLAFYNHPFWSLQTYADYAPLHGFSGVEVYNTACARDLGTADCTSAVYDDLLRLGNRMIPIAADDMHDKSALFGGWNTVLADKLSYRDLTEALERGDTYATTGPEIESLSVENGRITLSSTPVLNVFLHIDGKRSGIRTHHGGTPFTETVIDLPKNATRFRLELVDARGRRATTRAYYAEELS